jgi:hypothetical protein
MLVIGIDPGAAKTGIAWINEAGQSHFTTIQAENRIPFRYGAFRDLLADFLVELPEDPAVIAIEQPEEIPRPGEGENEIRGLIRMNCICAVIISEVTRLWPNINILPWPPRVWRRQNETKEDVEYRMSMKYGVDFNTDDESDAMGIADHAMMRILSSSKSPGTMTL